MAHNTKLEKHKTKKKKNDLNEIEEKKSSEKCFKIKTAANTFDFTQCYYVRSVGVGKTD